MFAITAITGLVDVTAELYFCKGDSKSWAKTMATSAMWTPKDQRSLLNKMYFYYSRILILRSIVVEAMISAEHLLNLMFLWLHRAARVGPQHDSYALAEIVAVVWKMFQNLDERDCRNSVECFLDF